MLGAARAKARRGELRISVPIGYVWHREAGLAFDPDQRLQGLIRLIFARFAEHGSARQALLSLQAEQVHFPRPSDRSGGAAPVWDLIRYRNVISVLTNPFYAGVYVYGKSAKRTAIIDGRARRSYGHGKAIADWDVMIQDHHEGYIAFDAYQRNRRQLALNTFARSGGVKSGRGGRALLVGLASCGRCGRKLSVSYAGRRTSRPTYRCDKPNLMLGLPRWIGFGGARVDAAITGEVVRALEPIAITAAMEARTMLTTRQDELREARCKDLSQARYEASLAERRYAACDPDNRLIAAQLERNGETALTAMEIPEPTIDSERLLGLADRVAVAWRHPEATSRTRQQIQRALIVDIMADVDDVTREVVLTIHWRGGCHSELKVGKPRTGEHGCATSDDALAVMRSMAGRWSDEHIAASLNRVGLPTGQGKTWTAHRVSSVRRVRAIHAYRSAEKDGEWLTMREAAAALGVTSHSIRRLTQGGVLATGQVMPGAPHQILAADLQSEAVRRAISRPARPCRLADADTLPIFTDA